MTSGNADSVTLRYSCDAPSGASCPLLGAYQDVLADTANVTTKDVTHIGAWRDLSSGVTDSLTSTTATGRSAYRIATNSSVAGSSTFTTAGTYTYSFYLTSAGPSNVLTLSSGGTLVTWTVTVTALQKNATNGSANVYISADTATAQNGRLAFLAATDSAIVASRGTAADPRLTGYAFVVVRNSAGDTRVAVASGFQPVEDSVTVTVSGPGLVRAGGMGANPAKSATLNVSNRAVFNQTETLAIYADGTAGTMTLTFTKGSTTLATKTVTFTGPAASITEPFLSDTYTNLNTANASTTSSVTLSAQLKDSGGTVLTSGTVYVFSSDTKIAGNVPSTAVFGQTSHACSDFTGTTTSTRLACSITLRDTGTVTLTVGDSWTVAASTWTSSAVTLTITGSTIASATVAFDKATYAPGERAVITITTKDVAGRAHANGTIGSLARAPLSNYSLSAVTTAVFMELLEVVMTLLTQQQFLSI